MAWIEAHQQLRDHPKLNELRAETGWDVDTAIGKLFRLWWWCMDYAEDGDLRRVSPAQIAGGIGIDPAQGRWLMDALKKAKWIDRKPYLRIHNWWKYAGPFLRSKYKRTPDNWKRVRNLYGGVDEAVTAPPLSGNVTVTGTPHQGLTPEHRTGPDLTGPNRTNQPNQPNRETGEQRTVELSANFQKAIGDLALSKLTPGEQQRLLDLRMPFGERSNARIIELDPAYCNWLLEECAKPEWKKPLGQELKNALRLRVMVKAAEVAR